MKRNLAAPEDRESQAATLLRDAKKMWISNFGEKEDEDGRLSVRVELRGRGMALDEDISAIPTHEEPCNMNPPSPSAHPDWKWLDPTSERIVQELVKAFQCNPTGWTTGEDLAALSGEVCSGTFRTLLSLLVERGIIISKQRYGYRPNVVQPSRGVPLNGDSSISESP